MKGTTGQPIIENLIKELKNGLDATSIAPQLRTLRTHALDFGDPLVTKLTRMCYEKLENDNNFDIRIEEMEVENDAESLSYIIQLFLDPKHPLNREELQEFKAELLGM